MPNYGYGNSQYSATTRAGYNVATSTVRPVSRAQARAASKLGIGNALRKRKKKERFTMLNWLRNKLRNFIYPQDELEQDILVSSSPDQIEESNTLRFTVTPARGGIVVQVRKYDRKIDDSIYTIHVIHDDEHVSERIAELVSMELLRA